MEHPIRFNIPNSMVYLIGFGRYDDSLGYGIIRIQRVGFISP